MTVTCIRNAPWVVAWDADRRQHYFRNDVDLVFEDNVIVYLDPGYAGPVDRLIDGHIGFDELNAGFDKLQDVKAIRQILTPHGVAS